MLASPAPAGAYYLFAALAVGACAFLARCVPETKGRSLEEIEREMARRFGGERPREWAPPELSSEAPAAVELQRHAEVV